MSDIANIKLPAGIKAEVKIHAINEGVTLTQFCVDAIREKLERDLKRKKKINCNY